MAMGQLNVVVVTSSWIPDLLIASFVSSLLVSRQEAGFTNLAVCANFTIFCKEDTDINTNDCRDMLGDSFPASVECRSSRVHFGPSGVWWNISPMTLESRSSRVHPGSWVWWKVSRESGIYISLCMPIPAVLVYCEMSHGSLKCMSCCVES